MQADDQRAVESATDKRIAAKGRSFAGQRATLIGLGTRTHVALARFLVGHGAEVTITDSKPEEQLKDEIDLLGGLRVRLSLGGHRLDEILPTDVVFVSPGVPREIPLLGELAARGVRISSEIELLFDVCPAPIVGITGSSGKTTTTALVGEMLVAGGRPALVGGNIGTPLIGRLEGMSLDSRVVLELSSFQLEHLRRSPSIGAVLNITPNHLDRHHTFERYVDAKSNLVRYQRESDYAVLGFDDPAARGLASVCSGRVLGFSQQAALQQGTYRHGDQLVSRWGGGEEAICNVREVKLRGQHNLYNVLAAAAVARADGVSLEAIRRVATSFRGVEHRLEIVAEIDGVRYVNDSIATSPERALAALRSFEEPIVLIAGGRSKHLPLDALAVEIGRRAKALVTLGEMAEEVEAAVRDGGGSMLPVWRCQEMAEAVRRAAACAEPGDVVLLSPGGTSFDQFRDFEERGRRFREVVGELARRRGV